MLTENYDEHLNTGAIYICGRAKNHQVVGVINIEKVINSPDLLEILNDVALYMFDWSLKNMSYPGHVE